MGLSIKCGKCRGSGDMGMIGSSRCNACKGTGKITIDDDDDQLLFEWLEGFFDSDTDEEWLIKQMKRMIEYRRKKK